MDCGLGLDQLSSRVRQRLVDPNLDYRLFEAALATSNVLSGTPELGVSDPKMLVRPG